MISDRLHRHLRPIRRSFTLIELLVVMGIIAIIATITVIAVASIANSARLSGAKNTITATLDNARSLAIRRNKTVLVAFRPREVNNDLDQRVDLITAEWSGDASVALVDPDDERNAVGRFEPIADVAVRSLPVGIKVAGPAYYQSFDNSGGSDFVWATQTHLPAIDDNGQGEQPGRMLAVMYASDGSVVTSNPQADTQRSFLNIADFDPSDETKRIPPSQYIEWDGQRVIDYAQTPPPTFSIDNFGITTDNSYFYQFDQDDEPFLVAVPFLAVFDDAEAREIRTENWQLLDGYAELVGSPSDSSPYYLRGYINDRAERIHFNRYTGVAMR